MAGSIFNPQGSEDRIRIWADLFFRAGRGDLGKIKAAFEQHKKEHARLDDGGKCFNEQQMAERHAAYGRAIEMAEDDNIELIGDDILRKDRHAILAARESQ